MKRSEINALIKKSILILNENNIKLPLFGYWSAADWINNKDVINTIADTMLGWDVTDFGSGDFNKTGAVLFTVRNGNVYNQTIGTPYAEKYILLNDVCQQEIPLHYHKNKTEDIISRAGGTLCLQLYNSNKDATPDFESPVTVWMDGIKKTFDPGYVVEVTQGNSITLTPYIYHRFFSKEATGVAVIGEVSSINDDMEDNVFYKKANRFCDIEEDEKQEYILAHQYKQILKDIKER